MAHMDIFNDKAFSLVEMTAAVEKMPYQPGLLGAMGLFTPKPVRTEFVSIEEKEGTLAVIQTSERGAPLETGRRTKRKIRAFQTVRLAKQDTIKAAEIQGVRAFGSETELMQVVTEVGERTRKLRDDLELTFEMHRLGAIQGKVLDADGELIIDWFTAFGISEPAPIPFLLGTATTNVDKICRNILRNMQRKSKGLWRPGSQVLALCGDEFFDMLTAHKTIRETYLNQAEASLLRRAFGNAVAGMDGAFATFSYGGILFVNYRGTDTFDDEATAGINAIGIKSTEAKLFPANTPGVFETAYSPAEFFDFVNTPGREVYAMTIPDRDRNSKVDVEVYSYPLFMCTRPEMLMTAVAETVPQGG